MIGARTGPDALRENVGKVRSRVGGCFMGSHVVFRGKDLHAELGDASWLDLYLFGITGRRFSSAQLRLLEAVWVYTSYPDARIWNNRVAALAGSARSTGNLAISAALAASEAAIFGRGIESQGQRDPDSPLRQGGGRRRARTSGARGAVRPPRPGRLRPSNLEPPGRAPGPDDDPRAHAWFG